MKEIICQIKYKSIGCPPLKLHCCTLDADKINEVGTILLINDDGFAFLHIGS